MDDFLKRGLIGLGVFFGGLAFIYLMMNFAGIKPKGIAADLFHGIAILVRIVLGIIVTSLVGFFVMLIFESRADEKRKLEAENKNQTVKKLVAEHHEEDLENKREQQLKKDEEKRLLKLKLAHLEKEKIEYLKNRSASEATKDALKDFL